ncbi:hypothetical protein NUH16_005393 [Penicillium rubens]|uniref:uncharacterized protein n=1 Tax=Penicillium rubens TaxID=1108849 RepID=UPI002A59E595|nr:uncharacterized protein N7525_002100 [Penicillium rubens]KAJ5033975.1 hypothetical protein NUH16_005393 [Penicillium rubens]KAJ5844359.1 hypothetical protein N7525_002100 [Penicillium rubens]
MLFVKSSSLKFQGAFGSRKYRQAKASNGNETPFCPYGQPQFELSKSNYLVVLIRLASEAAEITLNSVNPLQQPNIALSYVTNDHDIIALRDGIISAYNVLENAEKDIIEDEYP